MHPRLSSDGAAHRHLRRWKLRLAEYVQNHLARPACQSRQVAPPIRCMPIYVCVSRYVRLSICMSVHMLVSVRAPACMPACMYAGIHACMHSHIRVCAHTIMHACIRPAQRTQTQSVVGVPRRCRNTILCLEFWNVWLRVAQHTLRMWCAATASANLRPRARHTQTPHRPNRQPEPAQHTHSPKPHSANTHKNLPYHTSDPN